MPVRRAVFLDRDGTINRLVYDADHGLVDSPATPETFALVDGAGDAIRLLNALGLLAVVVSNQPGIAKGRFSEAHLNDVTERMRRELSGHAARLDAVYYCLHHPEAVKTEWRVACECRKPKAGLLRRGCGELNVDPAQSYMVGDGITDVLAGRAIGCTTFWIGRRGSDTYRALEDAGAIPDFIVADLWVAALIIAAREKSHANLP